MARGDLIKEALELVKQVRETDGTFFPNLTEESLGSFKDRDLKDVIRAAKKKLVTATSSTGSPPAAGPLDIPEPATPDNTAQSPVGNRVKSAGTLRRREQLIKKARETDLEGVSEITPLGGPVILPEPGNLNENRLHLSIVVNFILFIVEFSVLSLVFPWRFKHTMTQAEVDKYDRKDLIIEITPGELEDTEGQVMKTFASLVRLNSLGKRLTMTHYQSLSVVLTNSQAVASHLYSLDAYLRTVKAAELAELPADRTKWYNYRSKLSSSYDVLIRILDESRHILETLFGSKIDLEKYDKNATDCGAPTRLLACAYALIVGAKDSSRSTLSAWYQGRRAYQELGPSLQLQLSREVTRYYSAIESLVEQDAPTEVVRAFQRGELSHAKAELVVVVLHARSSNKILNMVKARVQESAVAELQEDDAMREKLGTLVAEVQGVLPPTLMKDLAGNIEVLHREQQEGYDTNGSAKAERD